MQMWHGRRHSQQRARRATALGFTLLELMVVLSVMAIITAAIVPVYSNSVGGIQARNARNDLVSILLFCQELAVRESREYRVCIDPRENSFWVMRLVDVDKNEKIFEDVAESWGEMQYLPEYMSFGRVSARRDRSVGGYHIACYPNGATDRVSVELRDDRDRRSSYTITTLGGLGKIEVK